MSEKEYLIAEYCKSFLKGNKNTQFITDLNISRDPGMLFQRRLAYYLYPIDIRGVRSGPFDSIIIFKNKKNFRYSIPEGFKIINPASSNIIIAVKENLSEDKK